MKRYNTYAGLQKPDGALAEAARKNTLKLAAQRTKLTGLARRSYTVQMMDEAYVAGHRAGRKTPKRRTSLRERNEHLEAENARLREIKSFDFMAAVSRLHPDADAAELARLANIMMGGGSL